MSDVLFEGKHILVRHRALGHKDRLVITFDFVRDRPDTRRHGFCEGMLNRLDVDAIHIISKENHWFQTRELKKAIALVAGLSSGYDAVLAIGSSMGGFGAMHYGARMGADLVLALSPQFSIDPARPPYDKRWRRSARYLIRRLRMLPSSLSLFPAAAIIVYDPHDADAKHVACYRSKARCIEVRLPFCGHPCTHTLADTGLLPTMLGDILSGSFDPDHWSIPGAGCAGGHSAICDNWLSEPAAGPGLPPCWQERRRCRRPSRQARRRSRADGGAGHGRGQSG